MKTILYFKCTAANAVSGKLAGVQEAAASFGWHVQVVKSIPSVKVMKDLVAFWQPVGAIADCGAYPDDIELKPFALLPSVLIDPAPTPAARPFCTICQDSTDTGRLAARELMTLGYECFAFVHPPEDRYWSREREAGFVQALGTSGFTAAVFHGVGGARRKSTGYLRNLGVFLTVLQKPCAVFVSNDITALEVIGIATALGLRIPEDLALLSVDNHVDICENTSPSLSSIQPDYRKCGHAAVLMLNGLISEPGTCKAPFHETFRSLGVIRRGSTRCPRGLSGEMTRALELIRREACSGLMARDVVKLFPCPRPIAEARFRKAVGRSILEEIQSVRLAKAYELLANPMIPMKAISDFCGFKSPNSLSRFFRLKTGGSMTDWRKSQSKSGRDVASSESQSILSGYCRGMSLRSGAWACV